MSNAEPARIQLHNFLLKLNKCAICQRPRSEHRTEWVPGAEGEQGQAVEIRREKR